MKICIYGGGNVGTQLAVHSAEKNHETWIYTSKPNLFSNTLEIVNENDEIIHRGEIKAATNNAEEAFKNADVIFVTIPAFALKEAKEAIKPFVKPGMIIIFVPGSGAGEYVMKEFLEEGVILSGIQRVPSVARLVEYGKCVRASGYRDIMHVASVPSSESNKIKGLVSSLLDMETEVLPNYLNLTMTPSNPILHTSRLYSLFRDYKEGVEYERIPLFYEEWSLDSAELLLSCDEEVQNIVKAIPLDLKGVKSLRVHYESDTAEALKNKIQSIQSFKGITTPSVKLDNGKFIPDLNSRYFTADFPFGLKILLDLASITNVEAPTMKKIYDWYKDLVNPKEYFEIQKYNINTLDDLLAFYK